MKASAEYIPYQYDLLQNLLTVSVQLISSYCYTLSYVEKGNEDGVSLTFDKNGGGGGGEIICHLFQVICFFLMELRTDLPAYFQQNEGVSSFELLLQQIVVLMRWIQPTTTTALSTFSKTISISPSTDSKVLLQPTEKKNTKQLQQQQQQTFLLLPTHLFAMIRHVLNIQALMNIFIMTGFGRDVLYHCFQYGWLQFCLERDDDAASDMGGEDIIEKEGIKIHHYTLQTIDNGKSSNLDSKTTTSVSTEEQQQQEEDSKENDMHNENEV
mmetsp:Transcript_5395/g.7888  ORF Transcript_5395/g.7888 Transcript_5395/m.7888 type:complete len:269 (+) Transcript_5395:887-1693(+)